MPLRFTLRQLEYLVAVGEAGSIARASDRMNVSPPSISAAISQLEDEFGIQLFVRKHSHGLSLIPGGREFFGAAKRVLEDASTLHDLAEDLAGQVRGTLAVGCLLTFAQVVLPELRRKFEGAWPDVRVRQYERDQAQILEMLHRAEIDIALTHDLEISRDVAFEPLLALPPYVMLPDDHPLAARKKVTLNQLADVPMVLLDLPMSRDYFLSILQSGARQPVIAERTGDIAIMRSLVANGYGFALANVRLRTNGKPVAYVPLDGDFRPMTMGLTTIAGARKTRTQQAFEEHCRTLITADGAPGLAVPGPKARRT